MEYKELLKKAFVTDDIVFFGHDHKAEAITAINGDGSTFNIIMGGQFNLSIDKESAFNAVIYDSNTNEIERFEFNWSVKENIFFSIPRGKIKKKKKGLTPTEEYLDKLLKDEQNISARFTDYYVLPKLVAEGVDFSSDKLVENIDFNDIFTAVKKNGAIRITGNSGSGKTALLRYLYAKSIDLGYMPILIEKRDYNSRIDKMFRDLFEEQYGTMYEHGYITYNQSDEANRIVFIDDLDLISSQKTQAHLIERILNSGSFLIYTTKEKDQDLEEIVKARLEGKTVNNIDIKPFYKETRDKLVKKVCKIYKKSPDEINAITTAFDYMAQCQTSFFSCTPSNILQYIEFFLQSGVRDHKGVQTISMVFETNIRNSLFSCVKQSVANVYLMALEYIADKMYFGLQAEKINISVLEEILNEYKNKKKAEIIVPKQFLNSCVKAQILKEEDKSFDVKFFDKNTYAYFVAKSLNREFENDQTNIEKLRFVMNHICFGINDTIIMFLSFIRSNTNIILKIADNATELMSKYPEWDIEKANIPFIQQLIDMSDKLPSSQDKNIHRQVEQVEKSA